MYSIVLLAAMTTATESPDCWFKAANCHGSCTGACSGSCYGSCYGSGYCSGSCHGACYGSCHGSCYGWGSSTCWGSSCYGSYTNCSGYGACYGCAGGYGYNYSCHGCYGCYGCFGSGCYGTTYQVAPAMPVAPAEPIKGPKGETLLPAKAKLTVELPSDAKLYIDDQAMTTSSAVRQFNTPELQPGQTYYYMVRVEVMQDGAPQSVSRRVLVRAGEEVTADFKELKAPVATVKK